MTEFYLFNKGTLRRSHNDNFSTPALFYFLT